MIITANKDICFQTINWWSGDHEYMDDLESDNNNKFLIKAFGRTENGDSLSLNILNFTPYFFIQIPTFVKGKNELLSLENWLRSLLPRKLKTSLIKASLMRKKTFYGFKNDEMFNFIRFTFKNIASFRYSIKLFQKEIIIPGINKNPEKFALYESNIEPILRMMHIKNIFPSGWLYLNKNAYLMNNDILTTKCKYDLSICWKNIVRIDKEKIAPISIVSFDLECTSSHGDFPVAAKSYSKLTNELFAYFNEHVKDLNLKENMMIELLKIFDISSIGIFSKVFIKDKDINIEQIHDKIKENIDDIYNYLSGKIIYKKKNDGKMTQDDILKAIIKILGKYHSKENRKIWEEDTRIWQGIFPELQGDCITQIGMTQHLYGDTDCNNKYVFTLGTCDDIDNVNVIRCKNESSLLLQFRDVINEIDPDIITGYNILGFDFSYLYERSIQLGIVNDFCKISRLNDHISNYIEKNLSSSALGENLLKFIEMEGRTIIDLMKVIQRDYKLDSYKLDNVASHFMNLNKNDVTPNEIFSLFKGSSADRKRLAEYCVQDCALCNQLVIKLEILANNIGMSNVCSIPLSYIFLRGQGIKIFSLVAKQCRDDDFLIPSLAKPWGVEDKDTEDEQGFEGATVLEPETGIYMNDPVNVLDYASLYPSSMISENLSHDCHLLDCDKGKYDNLPGINYIDITYDVYTGKADKKIKTGVDIRRFAQTTEGVLPRILKKLLGQRKTTRKKILYKTVLLNNGNTYSGLITKNDNYVSVYEIIENNTWTFHNNDIVKINDTYDTFQKAILDGLQLAYKVTANSLYGQTGSKMSPIYMKEVAACTTATGRNLIMKAKNFMETKYNAHTIYGDTDSIFIIFPNEEILENGDKIKLIGHKAIMKSIKTSQEASEQFKKLLKKPHDLEYEKTFFPFILLSKKRYCANKYEFDDKKYKMNSMGIVLKRRDNANIVKHIYGGILDIILNKLDVKASLKFLTSSLNDMITGKFSLEHFIITKSLKNSYANPLQIAHYQLSLRIGRRDIGNKPQANDRLPYAYIETKPLLKGEKKLLQGDRIEHPDYIRQHNLKIDYRHYLENQIMNPILQIYAIMLENLDGYKLGKNYFKNVEKTLMKEKNGDTEKVRKRLAMLREKEVKKLLFDPLLNKIDNKRNKNTEITEYLDKSSKI